MKKYISSLIILIMGIIIGIIIFLFINSFDNNSKQTINNIDNTSSSEENSKQEQIEEKTADIEISNDFYKDVLYELKETGNQYEVELTSGNYIVGVDIPIGLYYLEVTSGVGIVNIQSIEHGIFISQDISQNSEDYIDTYNLITNLRLYDNSVVSISGANVKLVSENAQSDEMRDKSQNEINLNEVDISSVYYVGVDIPSGVYDIEYIEGSGSVVTEGIDIGGIDAVFIDGEEMCKIYKNIELVEGTKFVVSGVKIKLTPSDRGFEINK